MHVRRVKHKHKQGGEVRKVPTDRPQTMMHATPEVRQPRADHGGKTLPADDSIATPATVAVTPQSADSPYDEAPSAAAAAAACMNTAPPRTAMTIIHRAYGPTADLYRDVLRIEPTATDREIRTAYFRRGRQVLKEPDGDGLLESSGYVGGSGRIGSEQQQQDGGAAAGPMSMAAVSQRSKLQFQAVSAAFDILSDPELKRQYDANGTVQPLAAAASLEDTDAARDGEGADADDVDTYRAPSTTVVTGTSLFLRSRSMEGGLRSSLNGRSGLQRNRSCNSSTGSSKRGIRWSNSVEELVIENDCASIASRRSWRCGGSLDGVEDGGGAAAAGAGAGGDKNVDRDDNLSVVSIESAASSVKETLRRLDESAETFTRKEFLDELESSVNTLIDAASRAIAEASAAAGVTANAPNAAALANNDESNNDTKGRTIEAVEKDSVSRKLNFDEPGEDTEPQKEQGEPPKSHADSPKETTSKADTNPKAATEEDPAADFYLFLSTYISGVVQELKGSLDQMGSLCANGELPSPSSCMIQDSELDDLVHMLRTEVDQHVEEINYPFDEIVGGESHLGKTIETFDTESVASTIATERNAPAGN